MFLPFIIQHNQLIIIKRQLFREYFFFFLFISTLVSMIKTPFFFNNLWALSKKNKKEVQVWAPLFFCLSHYCRFHDVKVVGRINGSNFHTLQYQSLPNTILPNIILQGLYTHNTTWCNYAFGITKRLWADLPYNEYTLWKRQQYNLLIKPLTIVHKIYNHANMECYLKKTSFFSNYW